MPPRTTQSSLADVWTGAAAARGLAAIALLLAVIVVFGVFSHLIEERRREIGIRLALGATRGQVRAALGRACRRPIIEGVWCWVSGCRLWPGRCCADSSSDSHRWTRPVTQ